MVFDIPNYVSLPFEIGVAILILYLDRQEKKREKVRQQKEFEYNQKQQQRFSNFVKETSKSQLFLLEAILESLDPVKAQAFKKLIQTKYSEEIQNDMNELEQLINRRISATDTEDLDPDVDQEIQQKMDELEASRAITKSLFSDKITDSIGNITKSTLVIVDELNPEKVLNHPEKLFDKNVIKNKLLELQKTIEQQKLEVVSEFANIGKELGEELALATGAGKEVKAENINEFIKQVLPKEIDIKKLMAKKKKMDKSSEEEES
ncbi:MAG: hypothetical protein INQ03_25905 [Candidatus Heimdallarchaeota archaeon]|nr:hypothetical protein [Candidatus Heimdallarchaeota archaeon]